MPDEPRTTTVEVKMDTWAALDKRKERGDSFNDVIRKLIDATPVGFGELREAEQEIQHRNLEELTASEMEDVDEQCSHYDIISGEACGNDVEFRQEYKFASADEWDEFYYCEEHAPGTGENNG